MTGIDSLRAGKNLRGQYAGIITRLAAFVIDTIALSASIVFISWFVRTSLSMLQLERISQLTPLLQEIYAFILSPLFGSVASFIFVIFYYVFFWWLAGQSIGKAVMGIKIVPNRGGKMTFTRSLLRFVGYIISALPLGLGFWWVLFDDRRLAWHDHLANTCVVYLWDAKPDEKFLAQAISEMHDRQKSFKNIFTRNRPVDTGSSPAMVEGLRQEDK
jgi:uncharacterized RDD family membrane protein YckC